MSSNTNIGNRPLNYLDANHVVIYDAVDDLAFQGDYNSTTNLTYKGFARPGSATSDPVWQIAYITWDSNNNPLTITWPENTSGFPSNDYQFIWDDRTGYTYS